jgi:hypothetical protein
MPLIEPQHQSLTTVGTSATGLATWPIASRMRGLALQIGSGLTGTVTFQGSIDGGQTYNSIAMTIGAGTLAATTTAAGLFTLMNPGLSHLRANCTTYSSGSCDCALGFST